MFKTVLAICSVICLWSGGAMAQGSVPGRAAPVSLERLTRHGEILKAYNVANVVEVASELGFTTSLAMTQERYPVIMLRDEKDSPIYVQPVVCSGTSARDECGGLLLIVYLQGTFRYPGNSLAQINKFNEVQYYARGHAMAGAQAILSRLIISDYGTARGNLGVEFVSFRSAAYNYASYLSQIRVASGAGSDADGRSAALVRPGSATGFAALEERAGLSELTELPGLLPTSSSAVQFPGGREDLDRLLDAWRKTGLLETFLSSSDGGR